MRLPLLFGLVTLAGLSLFGSTSQAQMAVAPATPRIGVPTYAPGTVYYRNGYYYQTPARAYYAPAYRVPVATNGAMTGRVSPNYDPSGRPILLYKPWLRPLR